MRLIDADSILVRFNNAIRSNNKSRGIKYILSLPLSEALEIVLNQAETVDPVKHGCWIEGCPTETTDYFNCSVCNAGIFVNNLWRVSHEDVSEIHRFCHNCGAKMDVKGA